MNNFKRIFCLMLVVLCMASFSVTAFASGGDEVPASTEESAKPTQTAKPSKDAEDVPYSYVIKEDGSVVITLNGSVTEEIKTTGKVVTNGGRLNLRTGAGMSYEIIDQLRCGEEVIVIGSEGDWYEVIVPEKKGFVHSNYLKLLETAQQNSSIDSALLTLIMQFMSQGLRGEVETGSAFTPNGNMSLIDDFFQLEAAATENNPQRDKQFITLESKNGNIFYLVIDRNGDEENVYFMNLVDEADLMALIETDDGTNAPVCSCTDKCTVGNIKTNCEICRTNMGECVGKEPVVEPEPTEPVEEPAKEKPGVNLLPILVLMIAGAGGGAFYWFKLHKPKTNTSGDSDLDDYDYGQDEEDYDEETEIDDADVMAESEENTQ